MKTTLSIHANGDNVSHIAIGTIGWLKDKNNSVRQCKCVKVIWADEYALHFWKVAGYTSLVASRSNEAYLEVANSGYACALKQYVGRIYKTREGANIGTCSASVHTNDAMEHNTSFSLPQMLAEHGYYDARYPNNPIVKASYLSKLYLTTYLVRKDNSIAKEGMTPFFLELDANGFNVWSKNYRTQSEAEAQLRELETYYLDEEDEVKEENKKIRLNIEIDVRLKDKLLSLGVTLL